MKTFQFTIVTERDEDGRYLAICPALPGCYTEGETEQEARELIEDAVQLHVEDQDHARRESGAGRPARELTSFRHPTSSHPLRCAGTAESCSCENPRELRAPPQPMTRLQHAEIHVTIRSRRIEACGDSRKPRSPHASG